MTLGASDLFQLAFLIVQSSSKIIGAKPIKKSLERVSQFFAVDEQGKLEINFPTNDPKAIEYYQRLLGAVKMTLENGFGKEYAKNLFMYNFEKIKSWSQSPDEFKIVEAAMPKFE